MKSINFLYLVSVFILFFGMGCSGGDDENIPNKDQEQGKGSVKITNIEAQKKQLRDYKLM